MPPQQIPRIDLGELKAHIVKKLGPDKSKQYFYYLTRFLSQKLGKKEFDKSCIRLLGGGNLHLHNHLIRSILKNACQSKAPTLKSSTHVTNSSPVREDGSYPNQSQNMMGPIWSNGVLPVSPQKGKSGICDRKLKDSQQTSLGLNGKVGHVSSHHWSSLENGDARTQFDYKRPMENPEPVAELPEKVVTEKPEDVEEGEASHLFQSPILAPLGIPFLSPSVGGAQTPIPIGYNGEYVSGYGSGELPGTEMLRKRMKQIALANGLAGGVSVNCANLLNNMLDLYLKGLIRSSVGLVAPDSSQEEQRKSSLGQHKLPAVSQGGKGINGIWPNNYSNNNNNHLQQHMQSSHRSISLHDFKVAMELNPKQLGEDWPVLLEKISMRSFEQ